MDGNGWDLLHITKNCQIFCEDLLEMDRDSWWHVINIYYEAGHSPQSLAFSTHPNVIRQHQNLQLVLGVQWLYYVPLRSVSAALFPVTKETVSGWVWLILLRQFNFIRFPLVPIAGHATVAGREKGVLASRIHGQVLLEVVELPNEGFRASHDLSHTASVLTPSGLCKDLSPWLQPILGYCKTMLKALVLAVFIP